MSKGEKILVVDDNVDNVELLSKRFLSLGFRVDTAYDGEEALRKVDSGHPDLIILDVMMPKLDGFEVCRRLKSNPRTRLIPIVMLTAKRDVPEKIKGFDIGADDYVTKPFDPKELVARVRGFLQRRTSEQRHATAEKLGALGQMAEGVAHEVRNPMVSIGGFARRIYDRLPPEDPLREYAAHILKEVQRLETMVGEIARFKTLMISPYQNFDLAGLLREVAASFDETLAECDIRLDLDVQREPLPMQGDSENLRLAFSNVINNAIEAMPAGGELSISLRRAETHPERVLIAFTDTGVGIPRRDLSNVFDPFFTTKMSGAGMGLTIVHRIVSRHGGEVDVRSEEGRGTTVSFDLPLAQEKTI